MRYSNSLYIGAFTLLLLLSSCAQLFEVRLDAETAYKSKQYIVATELLIPKYEKADGIIEKTRIATQIGECYRLANKTQQAEQWYRKAVEYDMEANVFFNYGLMLKANGKYDKASEVFTEYSKNFPIDRARATKEIRACNQAIAWLEKPEPIEVSQPSNLNSNASDFAPIIYNENTVIFTSSRNEAKGEEVYGWTGDKHWDIFVANSTEDAVFGQAKAISDSINTNYHEGTATFNEDFSLMYFTHCGSDAIEDDYCKIFKSERTPNGEWKLPERVYLFEVDTFNLVQPYLSPDGKQLYFSSDAPDGYGGKDLYFSKMTRDGWSYPKNLGPEINTERQEGFPFIHADGRLYFASNGHTGMGGLDIYSAEFKNEQWGTVKNLQAPINSPADDFSIVFFPFIKPELMDSIESMGYFASSRKGGQGNDDIYHFVKGFPVEEPETPEIDSTLLVKKEVIYILDANILENQRENANDPNSRIIQKAPLNGALVEVVGLSIESLIDKRVNTKADGKVICELEKDTEYRLAASMPSYFKKSMIVSTKDMNGAAGDTIVIRAELILDKIYKQVEVKIDNIYYDLAKWNIRPDAEPTLNQLAGLLLENPNIQVELGSHTDSRGNDRSNQQLSEKRANSVIDYLVRKGIDRRRLVPKGYGETSLVNECKDGVECSEEAHQANRRTTFKVISDQFKASGIGFN